MARFWRLAICLVPCCYSIGCSCTPAKDPIRQQSEKQDASKEAASESSPGSSSASEAGKTKQASPDGPATTEASNRTKSSAPPSGSSPQQLTAEAAAAKAEKLRSSAERQEAAGKAEAAFLSAIEAWELVREHPGDATCAQLEGELSTTVERLGQAVERQGGNVGIDTQDLIVK